jgi:hypothetical protein
MSKLPNFSIADFAEGLITEDVKPENRAKTHERTQRPHINASHWDDGMKNVKVTDDYVKQIAGIKESKAPAKPPVVQKVDINELIAEFKDLVSKAKTVLAEITTVGSIGTNLAGAKPKKKKKKKHGSMGAY